MSAPTGEARGVCIACGDVTGCWGAVRVGDQPVRLNHAIIVAKMCVSCGAIELRGREAAPPAVVSPARRGHGRALFDGVVCNVAEAVRALIRALRDRYRRTRE